MHRYEQSSREETIWQPGPGIRECCIASSDGHALSHWWWTVGQRFKKLQTVGLEDQEITKALLEQLEDVELYLEEVVPKPTQGQMRGYLDFRQDLGLPDVEVESSRRNAVPTCAKVLGIDTWPCTLEDLTKHWRQLALKHHPDQNGSAEVFQTYHKAYTKAKEALTKRIPP